MLLVPRGRVLAGLLALSMIWACPQAPTTGGSGGTRPRVASPAPSSGGTATSQPPTTGPSGPVPSAIATTRGVVLGLDGRPAAGVEVRAFVVAAIIANNGGGVIANNGGGVIANNGGSLIQRGRYHLAEAAAPQVVTRTDDQGEFSLTLAKDQVVNVEAVQAADVKAIAGMVTTTDGLRLQLAPTGSLRGRVTAAPERKITDFLGADIFIPGTSYVAKTAADGSYLMSDVPVGRYQLAAVKGTIGEGVSEVVAVLPRGTTEVATVVLARSVPTIQGVEPALGPVGTAITIRGEHFGQTAGRTFSVRVGGIAVDDAKRVSDGEITFVVPGGVKSGEVVVEVDGARSVGQPFRFVKQFALFVPGRGLVVGQPERLHAYAIDDADVVIADPPVAWTVDPATESLAVGADGTASPTAVGSAVVRATWGGLTAKAPVTVAVAAPLVGRRSALVGQPIAISPAKDGGFYLANEGMLARVPAGDGEIVKVAGDAPALYDLWSRPKDMLGDLPAAQAGFASIYGLATGADERLCVFDLDFIRLLGPDGLVVRAAGGENFDFTVQDGVGFVARTASPTQATFADGKFYFLDDGRIRTFDPTTKAVQTVVRPAIERPVTGLTSDGGRIYALQDAKVYRLEGTALQAEPAEGDNVLPGQAEPNGFPVGLAHVDGRFFTMQGHLLCQVTGLGLRSIAGAKVDVSEVIDGTGADARFVAAYFTTDNRSPLAVINGVLHVLDQAAIRRVAFVGGVVRVDTLLHSDRELAYEAKRQDAR